MSHFTVIVVGENIDEQLEPYAEQDVDPKYLEFVDVEDQYRKSYEEDLTEIVTLSNGKKLSKYNNEFRVREYCANGQDFKYPADAIIAEGHFNELYPTFEQYLTEWMGYEKDEKTGRFGYWANPNAKWDWYSIGGRWTGYFKTKPGKTGSLGRAGAFGNKPTPGYVDIINVEDIDIEGMRNAEVEAANKTYDQLEAILKGRPLPSWKKTLAKHNNDVNKARADYNSLGVVRDMAEAKFMPWGDLHDIFGESREQYVEKCKNNVLVPYAIVKDSKWFEKGTMGWFGISTDEMSEEQWATQFWDMLKSLEPGTKLTLVDCHI